MDSATTNSEIKDDSSQLDSHNGIINVGSRLHNITQGFTDRILSMNNLCFCHFL